jgi:tRNA pseudouridine32 synthase/23S rRNA pseudouridine746 synthase
MGADTSLIKNCFIDFNESIEHHPIPAKFTFPFYYQPHPLCVQAAKELQHYLQTQTEWKHNFGIGSQQEGLVIGKMFGVMVVQDSDGKIGYLAAFSGKLAGGNRHAHFVPPIFDMLTDGSFFRIGENEINDITIQIERLENSAEYASEKARLKQNTEQAHEAIEEHKAEIKKNKGYRKVSRLRNFSEMEHGNFNLFLEELKEESRREQYLLKDLKKHLAECEQQAIDFVSEINRLKELRKSMSFALQQKLFDQYNFLNQYGEPKNVCDIFGNASQPPAGAGECAAPKLLQYAFKTQLKPMAMAEFWWGESPTSEVRKHGHFYPACRGKCEPILAHMLQDVVMDENPMLVKPDIDITIETIYEDEHLVVINKPAAFLSVPGISVYDSVFARMRQKYPAATGPLIVHRLDMSTSGLMLIAKTKDVHQRLQDQFIKRSIKKRYVALLDGNIQDDEGFINLPIRVDLEDRPRQLVCYEYGKRAHTKYEVIERKNGRTKVYFYPLTGRTHQLRVHAAHSLGLDAPIVGDDLYGTKANRLHLHAESLEFTHPIGNELMTVQTDAPF